jgi:hypothetical protein
MVDFVLGRLKFKLQGAWVTSTAYIKDDIVTYGGNAFAAIANHTSAADFYTDTAKWTRITAGVDWKGAWVNSTLYKIDDIVKYGGVTYIATVGHTSNASGALHADSSNWTVYTDGTDWKAAWTTATYYKIGDVVKNGGHLYRAGTGHTSGASLEADISSWALWSEGFDFKNAHANATYYRVGDTVKYGASVYYCKTAHTSASAVMDETKFDLFASGLEFEDSWLIGTNYQTGDVVTYGGYNYVGIRANVGVIPYGNLSDWEILSTGFKTKGDYANGSQYSPGDVVRYGGDSYSAKINTLGNHPGEVSPDTNWELLNPGLKWLGAWSAATNYEPNHVVKENGTSWVSLRTHIGSASSGNEEKPSTNTNSPLATWEEVVTGNSTVSLSSRGGLLTRDATSHIQLGIGAAGAYLRSDGTDPSWETGPITVADGGTGVGTFTDNRVLTGNGTSAISDEANLTFDGSTLTVTGDISVTGAASWATIDATTSAVMATAKVSDLTSGRVVIAGTTGELEDDSDYTYNKATNVLTVPNATVGTQATLASASVTDLTDNRVVIAGASGELEDDANFTFDGTTFAVTAAVDITGDLDVDNINLNGNTITTTNTNGDLTVTPNGTGSIIVSSVVTGVTPTVDAHLATKGYTDSKINGSIYEYSIDSNNVLSYTKTDSDGSSATVDVENSVQWYLTPAGQAQTPSINSSGHLVLTITT